MRTRKGARPLLAGALSALFICGALSVAAPAYAAEDTAAAPETANAAAPAAEQSGDEDEDDDFDLTDYLPVECLQGAEYDYETNEFIRYVPVTFDNPTEAYLPKGNLIDYRPNGNEVFHIDDRLIDDNAAAFVGDAGGFPEARFGIGNAVKDGWYTTVFNVTVRAVDEHNIATDVLILPRILPKDDFGFSTGDGLNLGNIPGDAGLTAMGSLNGSSITGDRVKLTANQVHYGEDYDTLIQAVDGKTPLTAFDIKLSNMDGSEIHDNFGHLNITCFLGDKYSGQKVTIWHLHNDGSVSSETVEVLDGTVQFTVTDLSTFMVTLGEAPQPEVPGTDKPVVDNDNKDDNATVTPDNNNNAADNTEKPASDDMNDAKSASGDALPQTGDASTAVAGVAALGFALAAAGAFVSRRRMNL